MRSRKTDWTDQELKQLSGLATAGGTAFRAAAKFNRSVASCRNQARKLGTPFTPLRVVRMNIRAKCAEAAAPRAGLQR
jgi:hypothetical protein